MSELTERANREASAMLAEAGLFGCSSDIYRVVMEAYKSGYCDGVSEAKQQSDATVEADVARMARDYK